MDYEKVPKRMSIKAIGGRGSEESKIKLIYFERSC